MLTKRDFEEIEIEDLILNLASYLENIKKYDENHFIKKYFQWNKEILLSRWEDDWVESDVFFKEILIKKQENLRKNCSSEKHFV